MEIKKLDARTYRLTAEQWLPAPLEEVFEFFSDAGNLEKLTPPWIEFNIITPNITMRKGALIEYRLKIKGIPILWQSEIPVWDPPHSFVDNQLKGPYQRWYHRHLFSREANGTTIQDIIDYSVPGGALIHRMFVEPDVLKIFRYRQQVLDVLFPSQKTA